MTLSSLFTNRIFRVRICIGNVKCCSQMCSFQLSKATNVMFQNPCLRLQQYLEIPLLEEGNTYFDPSTKSMEACMEMFLPHKEKISRIASTIDPNKFPSHKLPEIAFLGRSNAGKTSILKAIFHSFPELRIDVSKKPGHTKSLKFYGVGTRLCLVDMPGYGFRQPEWFKTSVIPFLKKRKNLVKTFLLIDIKESFHAWDDASLQMLADLKIPFAVVLTKIDLVSDSDRLKNYLHIRNIMKDFPINTCFPQIFMLSSHTLEGFAYFIAFIAHITGNLNIKMES